MGHVILPGDSTLDNAAYVRAGEPAVIDQLRDRLPSGWQATLHALDGSTASRRASPICAMGNGCSEGGGCR